MRKFVIGIDEVGRGPLAGPLCVGAILMPRMLSWRNFSGLKDSKKLSAAQRESWATRIKNDTRVHYATAMVSASSIDARGIVQAARAAVAQALEQLESFVGTPLEGCQVLLDAGLFAPPAFAYQKSIIRGDESEVSIALASIVAKVWRDAYMVRMGKRYPAYGFAAHKGYGTAFHREKIEKHGFCKLHRRSFCRGLQVPKKSL